jgi:hypothetical protein
MPRNFRCKFRRAPTSDSRNRVNDVRARGSFFHSLKLWAAFRIVRPHGIVDRRIESPLNLHSNAREFGALKTNSFKLKQDRFSCA